MEGDVFLTIDGVETTGRPGTTILEAAQAIGVDIPRLCHDSEMRPSGNCRLCVVEVKGYRALVGSCHTPIAEGMIVQTRSSRVLDSRRATIELLLTGHKGPCVSDKEAHACALHRLASDLEVGPPRFRVREPRNYAVEEGPYLRRDMSRCVLCRKCVRACRELAGQNVYGIAHRGFGSKVVVDADRPLDKDVCRECGICAEHCPTSALTWLGSAREKGKATEKAKEALVEGARGDLLALLKERQRAEGFLSETALAEIAEKANLPCSEVYGVATFYSFLSTKPRGRNVVRVCKGLPCHLRESAGVIDAISRELGIRPGESTADGAFSFELANCIGACDKAPAMLINDTVHGDLTDAKIGEILRSYRENGGGDP